VFILKVLRMQKVLQNRAVFVSVHSRELRLSGWQWSERI
jgi:hypothetical protein